MEQIFRETEFEWDEYNIDKNWKRHGVRYTECEEVFFDPHLKTIPDEKHSQWEHRFLALGKTKTGRRLFVAFTQRVGKVRVISAREMSRKERRSYEEKIEKDASSEE